MARLAIIAAGMVGKVKKADRRDPVDPPRRTEATELLEAVAARDAGAAIAIARAMDREERLAAYPRLAPLAAFEAATRPIFYAHTIKNCEALHRLDRDDPAADATYLVALLDTWCRRAASCGCAASPTSRGIPGRSAPARTPLVKSAVARLTVLATVDNNRADRSDTVCMRLRLLSLVLATTTLVPACKAYDPLYCDENKPCTDPARPFCDLNGDYPESEGVARTCIAEPTMEPDGGDGSTADGAPGADANLERSIVQVSVGTHHTCAAISDGALRCWGAGEALGYRTIDDIGDTEHPYQAGDVPTGGRVKQVAAGGGFTCALYEAGNVRCWGDNEFGKLGYGHTDDLFGAGKTPDVLPDLELGGPASTITATDAHACAVLTSGDVRCWGNNDAYQLATGDQEGIGDTEVPGSRSPLQLGSDATSLSAALFATCALVEGGFVRCWGVLAGFSGGPLGHGGSEVIGDDETPAQAGNINIGGSASAVATGQDHICALLSEGRVRCWGLGGTLGYQEDEPIGDDETPASAGNVDVGGPVVELAAAGTSRCAILESGAVRCWGNNFAGVLGYGNPEAIGDNETPAQAGNVQISGNAVQLSSGGSPSRMCALLDDGALRCWGDNTRGALGLGHTDDIGDNEVPADVDPVRVLE